MLRALLDFTTHAGNLGGSLRGQEGSLSLGCQLLHEGPQMPSAGRFVLPWQAEAQGGTSSGLRYLGSQSGLPMVLGRPRGPQRNRSERYRPCPQHPPCLRTKAHLTSLNAIPQRFNKVWVALFLSLEIQYSSPGPAGFQLPVSAPPACCETVTFP